MPVEMTDDFKTEDVQLGTELLLEIDGAERQQLDAALLSIEMAKSAFRHYWSAVREAHDLPERVYYDPKTGKVYSTNG